MFSVGNRQISDLIKGRRTCVVVCLSVSVPVGNWQPVQGSFQVGFKGSESCSRPSPTKKNKIK